MATHVAFIRAVMLGRQGVEREELLRAFIAAGAGEPRSHLATGNVSFTARETAVPRIVEGVEQSLLRMAGTEKRVYVRSLAHLRELDRSEPFQDVDRQDVHELCVTFLPTGVHAALGLPFVSNRGDFSCLHAADGEIFGSTRLVGGRPGGLSAWVERQLRVPVTTRNWNTVLRMVRLDQ